MKLLMKLWSCKLSGLIRLLCIYRGKADHDVADEVVILWVTRTDQASLHLQGQSWPWCCWWSCDPVSYQDWSGFFAFTGAKLTMMLLMKLWSCELPGLIRPLCIYRGKADYGVADEVVILWVTRTDQASLHLQGQSWPWCCWWSCDPVSYQDWSGLFAFTGAKLTMVLLMKLWSCELPGLIRPLCIYRGKADHGVADEGSRSCELSGPHLDSSASAAVAGHSTGQLLPWSAWVDCCPVNVA